VAAASASPVVAENVAAVSGPARSSGMKAKLNLVAEKLDQVPEQSISTRFAG